MPPDEGLALHEAAAGLPVAVAGPLLEIGSYCGKSALYLGAAAAATGRVLFCVDHHRGSEENQPGWEWHEPDLVDPAAGRIDTLPWFRRTVFEAGLEDVVIAVVGESTRWRAGGPPRWHCCSSTAGTAAPSPTPTTRPGPPRVAPGGRLVIHDVFPDPRDGGRPPFEIYRRALDVDGFAEIAACGSLRVLERP